MPLNGSQGDVVADLGPQVAQGFDQQGRRGLAVDIEIAPNQDGFAAADGLPQSNDGPLQVGQVAGWGRGVLLGIQEGPHLRRIGPAALGQGFHDQRVQPQLGLQLSECGGNFNRLRFDPGFRHAISVYVCRH